MTELLLTLAEDVNQQEPGAERRIDREKLTVWTPGRDTFAKSHSEFATGATMP